MSISRRAFFKELFSRRMIRRLNPLPIREISQALEAYSPSRKQKAMSCEEAGLALAGINRKSSADSVGAPNRDGPRLEVPAAVVRVMEPQGPATADDARPGGTGE